MGVYNENRDNNNSIHDEIREQNAKLKDAPLNDKLKYFKDYYLKKTIILVIVAAAIINIAYNIITAPEDSAFCAYFFNDAGMNIESTLVDNFAKKMNIDTKKHRVYIDSTISFDPSQTDFNSYASIEKTSASVAAKELDVIVGDEKVIDYFAKNGYFHDVTEFLSEKTYSKYMDDFYYAENDEGKTVPVGIYITDAPMLQKYNHYTGQQPIIGFVVNSVNPENTAAFFKYLFNHDLDDILKNKED